MIGLLSGPGFLGTRAPLYADLTLILIILSSLLFTIGWQLILRRKVEAHRWTQTGAAILNAVVVSVIMIASFLKNIAPGIPAKLLQGDYGVATVHGFIGSAGLLLGIFIVLRANGLMPRALRFSNYKAFMRTSYSLYMLATLLGIVVYISVYG